MSMSLSAELPLFVIVCLCDEQALLIILPTELDCPHCYLLPFCRLPSRTSRDNGEDQLESSFDRLRLLFS